MSSTRWGPKLTGAVGNVLEWYDFAVFGFVAPLMSSQFFPASDKTSALIKTFGVFAAGYLARPIGGVLFGQIGDRLGRKRALQLSVAMMAIPTSLMTILPTHEQVGLLAPILLVVLRLAQGLSVGGEFIGSSTYLVEVAPEGRRASSGSWTMFGAVLGLLLGSAVATLAHHLLTPAQISTWGWRLPFLGGLLIGIIGWQMRHGLHETAEFVEMQRTGNIEKQPVVKALKEAPLQVIQVAGIALLLGVGIYTLFVWMPTYLTNFVKPPIANALLINTLAMAFMLVLMPLAGRLGDLIGYKTVLVASSLGIGLTAYPLFRWMDSGSVVAVSVAMGVFAVFMAGLQATLAVAMAELFPPRLRFSGTAIGYNLTLALFGGTAPLFATWLIAKTGDLTSPAWYLTVVAIVSLLFTLSIQTHQEKKMEN
ncbi:MFS transporter [Bythopirellula goksoeyrii]|uniref:Proline/betaine transporter n=1 Tax=Bythopirellula goksoeyrii TaxID=1400387 RepID=A0A5B9Q8U5_9BACT|nr:MFS transporter [Bythopirellula goksoeyrii]QEG33965.1 Proline/betaine transporter [Bythopirellula goksoeyrii]